MEEFNNGNQSDNPNLTTDQNQNLYGEEAPPEDPDQMQQELLFQEQMAQDEEMELKKKIALYYH